jgi:predicted ArsR family transcriptional regulator
MRASLVLGAGRGSRLSVLETLKRFPEGACITELTVELGMSYMGIKAHCLALEKAGHIESRRGVSSKGRPRLIYRLSHRGEELFAEQGQDMVLDLLREASALFGVTSPQKLLAMYFRSQTARYASRISTSGTVERAVAFVRMRDAEGRISVLKEGLPAEIQECHDPLADLRKTYPGIGAMEEAMVSEVIGVPVIRIGNGNRVIYRFTPAGNP